MLQIENLLKYMVLTVFEVYLINEASHDVRVSCLIPEPSQCWYENTIKFEITIIINKKFVKGVSHTKAFN